MKLIICMLVFLLGVLQYQLWFAEGGIMNAMHLKEKSQAQAKLSQTLLKRNAVLSADINDLKHGKQAVEAHARYDLGMVKKGEVFYQITSDSR